MTDRANWLDDSVLSNVAYPIGAFGAWGSVAFAPVLIAGLVLGVCSAAYHATYERRWRLADVVGMMFFLAMFAGASWGTALGVLPAVWIGGALLVGVVYGEVVEYINSYVHAPAWIAVGLAGVAYSVGGWVCLPVALIVPGGLVKLVQPGADSVWHSVWHLSGGASAFSALYLLFQTSL